MEDKLCSWIGRIHTVKMIYYLPKAIYRFNAIKIPMAFFVEIEQIILKLVWKYKIPQIHKSSRKNTRNSTKTKKKKKRKKEQSWRKQATCLWTILQSYGNQNSVVRAQNRNMDKWNRIESSEINPHTYGQLIYNKGGRNMQWRKDSLFNK